MENHFDAFGKSVLSLKTVPNKSLLKQHMFVFVDAMMFRKS